MDYSGALNCKNVFNSDSNDENGMFKCYIVIYSCASTSGVILDLVRDASADTFVNSLSKFISRRSCPQLIAVHFLLIPHNISLMIKTFSGNLH